MNRRDAVKLAEYGTLQLFILAHRLNGQVYALELLRTGLKARGLLSGDTRGMIMDCVKQLFAAQFWASRLLLVHVRVMHHGCAS